MLILTCCHFFLYFFAVIPRSPSMLWFSFPTLTPAVWLNQSDRLWVPGGSLSLSAVPFLLKFTLSVTNSFWHPFVKERSLLDAPPWSLHTQAYTQRLSAQSVQRTCHTQGTHTHRSRNTHKHDNMGRHKYTQDAAEKEDALYPLGTHNMPHTPLP